MRPPDHIPPSGVLHRWWIFRKPWGNLWLHHLLKSDSSKYHDHPWWSVTIAFGRYVEHFLDGSSRVVWPLWPAFRRALRPHRIELRWGPVWTIFITGPQKYQWRSYESKS